MVLPVSNGNVSDPNEWETQKAWFQTIGYDWWSEAAEAIHRDTHKTQLISGGEQAGKSYTSAFEAAWRIFAYGLAYPPEPSEKREYWLIASDYNKSSEEFEKILDILRMFGLVIKVINETNQNDKRSIHIKFTSDPKEPVTKIITKSGKYPESSLSKVGPRGILGCEMSQCTLDTFHRCVGRQAPRNAWFLMSGTFEHSSGWYIDAFKRWQVNNEGGSKSFLLPSWSNLKIYPGGYDDPKIQDAKAKLEDEFFRMRFGGEPTTPRGAVFGDVFSPLIHIRDDIACFDPDEEILIATDPGWKHANVIELIQIRNGLVCLIDEMYVTGMHTSGEDGIIGAFERWRNPETGFFYIDSMKSRRGYCDIAGTQNRPEGPPVVQIWRDELHIELMSNHIGVHDGINMLKRFLQPNTVTGKASMYVNSRCKGFIAECGHGLNPLTGMPSIYSWKTDDLGNNTGLEPIKVNDDCVKAVWYLLMGEFLPSQPAYRSRGKKKRRPNERVLV